MMSRGSFRRGPKSKYVPGVHVGPYVISGYVGDNPDTSMSVKIQCVHGKEFAYFISRMSDLRKVKVCRCLHPTCRIQQTL